MEFFNLNLSKVQEMLKENGNPPAKFDVDTLTAFRVVVEATAIGAIFSPISVIFESFCN